MASQQKGLTEALATLSVSPPQKEVSEKVRVNVGEGRTILADRQRLVRESQFFRALYSFHDGDDGDGTIDLSCDVSPDVLEWILIAIGAVDGDVEPISDCSHAYGILRGSAYLQCDYSETLVTDYILPMLDPSICFTTAINAHENGCVELFSQVEKFVLKSLRTHIYRPDSLLEIFRLDLDNFKHVVQEHVTDNELSFFAVFGWVLFDIEERRSCLDELLRLVCVELVGQDQIQKSDILKHFPEVGEAVLREAEEYRQLSLNERISYWSNHDPPPKWPKMQVLCSSGYFEKMISCCSPGGRWHRLTAKPQKLLSKSLGSQMVAIGGVLYFIGGDGNDALWTYDVSVDSWKQVSTMQTLRIRPAVAVVGTKIYVFGGSDNHGCLDSAECFDTVSKTWAMLTPMSTYRTGAATLIHNDKIYLMGGMQKRHQLTQIISYDPVTDDYSEVTDIPHVVADFGVCSAGDKAYLFGGFDPLTFTPVADVHVYDLFKKKWSTLPSLTKGKKSSACFYDGTMLYSCGGWNDFSPATEGASESSCERFNFENGCWEAASGLPKALQTSVVSVSVDVPVRLMDNFRDYSASNCRVKSVNRVKLSKNGLRK